MRTILTTTFAFALMVSAFNTSPAMASGEKHTWEWCKDRMYLIHCKSKFGYGTGYSAIEGEIDEIHDPEQANAEREVADSDAENSTSAADATEQ